MPMKHIIIAGITAIAAVYVYNKILSPNFGLPALF